MESQKSETQLEQEASDAMLARQLQEQMDREEQEAAARASAGANLPPAAPTPVMENGTLTVACTACTFINEIPNAVPGKRYRCKQCRTALPTPAAPLAPKEEPGTIECSVCHLLNRIPKEKSDAILCGACYQQLAPPQQETAPPQGGTRTVQVRCGQCSAVNAVQVNADAVVVQFECGSCETVNEVALA